MTLIRNSTLHPVNSPEIDKLWEELRSYGPRHIRLVERIYISDKERAELKSIDERRMAILKEIHNLENPN